MQEDEETNATEAAEELALDPAIELYEHALLWFGLAPLL